MLNLLSNLRKNVAIGFVGGSDLAKVPFPSHAPFHPDAPKPQTNTHLSATRTAWNILYPRNQPLRFLLLGKRSYSLQIWPPPRFSLLYKMDWRGQVQAHGQVYLTLHCGSGYPGKERHIY